MYPVSLTADEALTNGLFSYSCKARDILRKRVSLRSRKTQPCDHCDNVWNCNIAKFNHIGAFMRTERCAGKRSILSVSRSLPMSWTSMLPSMLFTAFWMMFSFLFSASPFLETTYRNLSCALNRVGTLILYGLCGFAWMLSGISFRNYVPSSIFTEGMLSWKRSEMNSQVSPSNTPYVLTETKSLQLCKRAPFHARGAPHFYSTEFESLQCRPEAWYLVLPTLHECFRC